MQHVAKYQKSEGGHFGDIKNFFDENQKMRILNSLIVPKRGETLRDLLTFILMQNIKLKRDPLVQSSNPNLFEKMSHSAEKNLR